MHYTAPPGSENHGTAGRTPASSKDKLIHAEGKEPKKKHDANPPLQIVLTRRFIVLSFIFASSVAFEVGIFCRQIIVPNKLAAVDKVMKSRQEQTSAFSKSAGRIFSFLNPFQREDLNSNTVLSSKIPKDDDVTKSRRMSLSEEEQRTDPSRKQTTTLDHQEGLGEEVGIVQSSNCKHLQVDIENVDGVFLNSVRQLKGAMFELLVAEQEREVRMLTFHCHRLQSIGVRCIVVFPTDRVSLYTWPVLGSLAIDIFSCGRKNSSFNLTVIENLFAVPRRHSVTSGAVGPPYIKWAQKPRGFLHGEEKFNPGAVDLNQYFLGWMEFGMKAKVVSEDTDFQTVDIYDIVDPRFRCLESYQKSLIEGGDSYEAEHPDLFRPDRVVYLDNVMQSRLFGEAAYHEALVHPAMFAHKRPRRVAIIGGGEGATLREVLKHNTVEKVTMIEIDEDFVDLARDHLEDWNDCSNLVGSVESCFDDPRVDVRYEDAIAWFSSRFATDSFSNEEKFDVIIVDALDPCSVVAFSDHIYNDRGFADALHNGLGEEGVLVIQTGETDSQEEPPTEYLSDSSDARFTRHLLDAGFVSMLNFEDSHGGFLGVWSFLVVFKDLKTKGRWYANQAEVDRRIQGRVLETVEEPLFRHFDGATMMTYQYPSRSTENDFCHETKPPLMCDMGHGFDPFAPNAPVSAFHLNKSDATSLSDPRLYVNKDVVKGSYVAIEDSVNKLILDPRTSYLVEANKKSSEVLRFKKFVEKHGFASCYYGDRAYVVDTGDLYFTNDQCMGVFEVENGITAAEYVLEDPPDPLLLHLAFNPLFERNHITYMTSAPDVRKFFQDVKAGEDVSDIVCSHVERSWNGMQARRPKVEDMKHKF